MNTFGNRLKNLRKNKKITLEELGKAIGKSESTMQRYESGAIANIDNDIVEKLAKKLGVSPVYLMGWTDIKTEDVIRIPVLGKIACGDPITAEENIEEFRERPTNNLPSGELFYLNAKGDSMEPRIPDGSYVLIREQNDVENGEIAAVLVNGDTEATLKKVRKLDGVVLLEAVNDAYEPYIISKDNPAKILGKAVEVSFDL